MRLAFEIVADNDEPSDSNEEREIVRIRLLEFWDIVDMSFSNGEAEHLVTTYPSFAPPIVLNRNLWWCPISENQKELCSWLEYSPRVREAIRRGFRRGLGELSNYGQNERFEDWIERKAGFVTGTRPLINLMINYAENDRKFDLARKRLEFLLLTVYQSGKFIPYHPDFDRFFIAKLSGLPLHRTSEFLAETCQSNGLNNVAGYEYIADLLTEVEEGAWCQSPSKIERARTWLGEMSKTEKSELLDAVSPAPYPWELIDDLAKKVGLRREGEFTTADKFVAAAMAGFIDALREFQILPQSTSLPIIYGEFSKYYGRTIKADRTIPTRTQWVKKTRDVLRGL